MEKIQKYIEWFFSKLWSCASIPCQTYWSKRNLVRSILWLIFTVGLALIGTIINVIKIAFFDISINMSNICFLKKVAYSIYLDSRSGTFYTFSIVMAASTLYPLFEGFIKHNFHYLNLRVLAIIVALLLLTFGGVFYSFSSIKYQAVAAIVNYEPCIDWYQLAFFLVAVCISTYSFGLGLMMDEHKSNPHPEIDDYDYAGKESAEVEKLNEDVQQHTHIYNNIHM